MKRLFGILLAFVLLLSMAGCSGQESSGGELNILTWDGYIPDEVVADFQKETGITINYSSADDNETMFSKLQAANGGEFDILICSDYIIYAMLEEGGLLGELDKTKLSNFANIDPAYQNQYYDPENKYTVPFAASSAILVYDTAAVDFDITGYSDLWNPELKDAIVLLDGDRDIIGLTLQMMGYSLNETDPAILEEALEKLKDLKPNVIAFNANTPHEAIISGEASVGYMFGSQATAAMEARDTVKFVYPREGLGLYIDNIVMTANAPNKDNAHILINYLLDAENAAAVSNSINYPCCNTAARAYLSDAYLENEMVNIPDDVLKNAESYADLGEARSLYSRIWTEFKSY